MIYKKKSFSQFSWCLFVFTLFSYFCVSHIEAANESSLKSIIPENFFTDVDSFENSFQNSVDELFDYYKFDIDTSGWCTSRINDTTNDNLELSDTIRITLSDESRKSSFVFPFKNYITSPFGPRGAYFHFGIDIKLVVGDSIRCALDGLVRIVGNDKRGYGKVIVIRHHSGLETIYGHLSKCIVKPNTKVSAGEVIGLGGNSGRSSGSHLHFETRYCGQPFDPLAIMNFETYSVKSDTLVITSQDFAYSTELKNSVVHKVKKGETLSGISSKYRISIKKLCSLNNITPKTLLKAGRNLIVRKGSTGSEEKVVQVSN